MPGRFDYFVVFAEMRTGSNFLEENLNAMAGLHCWGEAFNPHFVGHAGKTVMAGVTKDERDADPRRLIDAVRRETRGLAGFRFFHDHDPRVREACLDDPRCAKVVLTRNPLDSYVSLKIARRTGQWRLNDMKSARAAQIAFDAAEFAEHLGALQRFQIEILHRLQVSGQTAFYVAYEDLRDVGVLNGLGRFLGAEAQLDKPVARTKVQNPGALEDKVANFDEMAKALSGMDFFDLGRTPNFEPRRGPGVPGYVAAARTPLLFMPIAGGPKARVRAWLAALDDVDDAALGTGHTQKDLRRWLREAPTHRSFTVLRDPVARLHAVFCREILPAVDGDDGRAALRHTLRSDYGVPLPPDGPGPGYDAKAHRAAFSAFARFVKGNLGGQTNLKVEKSWASQHMLVQGMADFAPPEMILREDDLDDGLAFLAARVGRSAPPVPAAAEPGPFPLAKIRDAEIEALVRETYPRDYLLYGFGRAG